MHIRTSLAVRALRGARTAPAAACGVVTLPIALAAGGLAAAVPAVATVTLSVALATAVTGRPRRASGLTGIARTWARAHPWRYAAAPAAALTAVLLSVDAATGWPYAGAVLAGLGVLTAARIAAVRPARGPVRSPAPLTGRRLVRAVRIPSPVTPEPDPAPARVPALS